MAPFLHGNQHAQQYISHEKQRYLQHIHNTGQLPLQYAANGTPILDLAPFGVNADGAMTNATTPKSKKPFDFLMANSQRDNGASPLVVNGSNATAMAVQPIGTRSGPVTPAKKPVYFTTDIVPGQWVGNRYMLLSNVHKDELEQGGNFANLSEDCGWELKLYTCQAVMNPATGKLDYYLVFNDLRGAESAFDEVSMFIENNDCSWKVSWSSYSDFTTAVASVGDVLKDNLSYYDGQVMFHANFKGPSAEYTIEGVELAVDKVANMYGQVRSFAEVEGAEHPNIIYRVEYYTISDAHRALKEASKDQARSEQKWQIHAEVLKPSSKPSSVNGVDGVTDALAGAHLTTPRRSHDGSNLSPTGRSAWKLDEHGNAIPMPMSRNMPVMPSFGTVFNGPPAVAAYGAPPMHRFSEPMMGSPGMVDTFTPRSGSYPGADNASHHHAHRGSPTEGRRPVPGPQAVDLDRIRRGHDMRTTLMMRNIPNRMMAQELKSIIDKTSLGKYDFSYLRIDFEKGTNVGYAFVNFVDPVDIIAFVEEYVGKQWAPPNKRVVELSYATIQGTDCLIEKFRNSAVMSECPHYRPMMWYTTETAPSADLVGTAAKFPAPNNNMKLQRSHDNAGQVGLYAPRSVRESRGTRGRNSHYDRGTPHQQYEDAYYHNMSPTPIPHNGGQYSYGPPQYPVMHPMAPPAWPMHMMSPYSHGMMHGYMPAQHMPVMPYGNGFTNADPFYNGNHNGHQRPFGTGPDVPDSRRRTITNGKLGYATKKYFDGGPVQPPADLNMPRIMNGEAEYAGENHNGGQGAVRNPSPHQV